MIDVSIIIVNYKTCELLCNCIQSIISETKIYSYEVIVIDNASKDGSANIVKKKYPHIKLIENKTNKGFAYANNQGINITKGDYILLLNPDTVIIQSAIDKMIHYIKSNTHINALGCKLLNADMSLQPSCYRFPRLLPLIANILHLWIILPLRKTFLLSSLLNKGYEDIHPVDCVRGACLLTYKGIFKEIGLLDESFFMYAEETDWCYRLKKSGYSLYYFPEAKIIHYQGQSSKINYTTNMIQRQESIKIYYIKHYGKTVANIYLLLMFINNLIKIVEYSIVDIFLLIFKRPLLSIIPFIKINMWILAIHFKKSFKSKAKF